MDPSLKSLLDFVIGTVQDADSALSDGWQFTDIFKLLPDALQIPGEVKSAAPAWKALQVMTEDQKVEYVNYVEQKLSLPHADAEEKIEAVFNWMLQTDVLFNTFRKKPVPPVPPAAKKV